MEEGRVAELPEERCGSGRRVAELTECSSEWVIVGEVNSLPDRKRNIFYFRVIRFVFFSRFNLGMLQHNKVHADTVSSSERREQIVGIQSRCGIHRFAILFLPLWAVLGPGYVTSRAAVPMAHPASTSRAAASGQSFRRGHRAAVTRRDGRRGKVVRYSRGNLLCPFPELHNKPRSVRVHRVFPRSRGDSNG